MPEGALLAAVDVVVGVYLVEPYLSLTTSTSTTWEKLVQAFPSLHADLTSIKKLLDLTTPVFSFVSDERFKDCLYSLAFSPPVYQTGDPGVQKNRRQFGAIALMWKIL